MPDLIQFKAKLCYTAAGLLIHEQRVLLVKHKKLNFWLAPGGHCEDNELPHQTAEREFWEEAGIQVTAFDPFLPIIDGGAQTQSLPRPLMSNLHWVSRENYDARLRSEHPDRRVSSSLWPKGCEQHWGELFLVKPVGSVKFVQNEEESTGIGWFTLEEVLAMDETRDEIKNEVAAGFAVLEKAERTR